MRTILLWMIAFNIAIASQLENLRKLLNATDISIPSIEPPGGTGALFQLLGSITSFDFYKTNGQQNFTEPNVDISTNRLIYYSNDTYLKLADVDNSANITRITPFKKDSFILSGDGTFLNLNLRQQLLYNISDLSVKSIFNTELGDVNGVLVDGDLVYFGGEFEVEVNSDLGHSAVIWDSSNNSTTLLPFLGFGNDSVINSILKLNNENILFTGNFSTFDNSTYLINNNNSRNYSENIENIEVGTQISLREATWDADGTLDTSQFICPDPSKEAWLNSGPTGKLTCNFPNVLTLSKIRIYNSPNTDNEISLFRLLSMPSGGIMNLTYLDPMTHELKSCTEYCPLYTRMALQRASDNATSERDFIRFINGNSTNLKWTSEYQEFAFVNQVPTSSLQFVAGNSYQSNVGLSGFQLYQESFPIFPNNSFNQPNCQSYMGGNSYSSLLSGNFFTVQNDNSYLMSTYIPNQDAKPEVSYLVDVVVPGNYTINLVTPGCLKDNTCSTRGIVNVTVSDNKSNDILSSILVYQNNNELKYDQIFSGQLMDSVVVTVNYYSGLQTTTTTMSFVAGTVEVIRTSIDDGYINEQLSIGDNTTLNGIFEYSPSNATEYYQGQSSFKIDNSSLATLGYRKFGTGNSIFAAELNNTIYLAGSNGLLSGVYTDSEFIEKSEYSISGKISNLFTALKGIIIYGDLHYSGNSYGSLIITDNVSIPSFNNISDIKNILNVTLSEELLIINNDQVFYELNDDHYQNNDTEIIRISSAGKNLNEDLLLFGQVLRNTTEFSNTSLNVFGNSTVNTFDISNSSSLYAGLYLNDSLSVYGSQANSRYSLELSDGQALPWSSPSLITPLIYNNNQKILVATAVNGSGLDLKLFKLDGFEQVANVKIGDSQTINSVLNFETNSSLLVGGNFSLQDSNCVGLCLFNYTSSNWAPFQNNSISGVITDMAVFNDTSIILAGNITVNSTNHINILELDMSTQKVISLLANNSTPLERFLITNRSSIVAWNNEISMFYNNSKWVTLPVTDISSSFEIRDIEAFTTNSTNNDILLFSGQFNTTRYGRLTGLLYDFETWYPYFYVNSVSKTGNPSLFSNSDNSKFANTNMTLPQSVFAMSSTTHTSTSTATPTDISGHEKHRERHYRIERGFIVLISLALSLATVIILGLFGAIIAISMKPRSSSEARVITSSQTDNMAGSGIPPEKLLSIL